MTKENNVIEQNPDPENTATDIFAAIVLAAKGQAVFSEGNIVRQCTDSLMKIYAKEVDEKTGLVLENLGVESAIFTMRAAVAGMVAVDAGKKKLKENGYRVSHVYSADYARANPSDVFRFKAIVHQLRPDEISASALILDSGQGDGAVTDPQMIEQNRFSLQLESIAKKHGIRVFRSLHDFEGAKK